MMIDVNFVRTMAIYHLLIDYVIPGSNGQQ